MSSRMALSHHTIFSSNPTKPSLHSNFLPSLKLTISNNSINLIRPPNPITCSSSPSLKIVKNPSLDNHIVKQNKMRFVQKLKTLLLSKPKHFIPIRILYKCRSYLSLHKPKSILSMIHRYPSIFQLFTIPSHSPLSPNCEQLCVGLTEQALALSVQEQTLKASIESLLANKLQKLLMLATHHRLLLNKLVHLGPDLGLPRNFRSCLCNQYPDRFKVVETSYGRALELVSWDSSLAVPLETTLLRDWTKDLIVERPLKFKHVRLRRGVNVKRKHREYLIKFQELGEEVGLYREEEVGGIGIRPETMAAEKRACGVVREVLGMTMERRTLVDHLTHFRKDFGLPNKLRGMIVRHPELFYVSMKGERDSVFLLEGYDDKGGLVVKDELVEAKERLMGLVRESKVMRRERRNFNGGCQETDVDDFVAYDSGGGDHDDGGCEDGFEDLFVDGEEWESFEDGGEEELVFDDGGEVQFWSAEGSIQHW
ncbi:hypothetical protein Scep_011068 [Stephania cephalantha]|uniref:PORR domain-containing protein n=1 Tax=Stephania cephalantha TaxID=152367 RepID=A0AAP0JWD0_9MAGN